MFVAPASTAFEISPARVQQAIQTPPTTPKHAHFILDDEEHADDEAEFFRKSERYEHNRTFLRSPTTLRVQRRNDIQQMRLREEDKPPVFDLQPQPKKARSESLSDKEKLENFEWRLQHLKAKPAIDFGRLRMERRDKKKEEIQRIDEEAVPDTKPMEQQEQQQRVRPTKQKKEYVKIQRPNNRVQEDSGCGDCDDGECKLGAHQGEMICVSIVVGLAAIGMQYFFVGSA